MPALDIVDRLKLLASGDHLDLADIVCADAIEAIARLRSDTVEECAKVLDEAARDWRRIRDPGMANNAASYARRIRALALSSQDRG